MKKDYFIAYDEVLKEWVVWLRLSKNAAQQVYANKLKRNCKKWIEKKK